MNHYDTSKSASALAEELGRRLRQARLEANISQDALASRAGLSRRAVQYAEAGKSQLDTFLALLLALGLDSQLDNLLPPRPLSPLQLLKLQGQPRQRAARQQPQATQAVGKDETAW